MLRSLLRWLKQIVAAIIALVVLVCFIEIGLRVYDSHTCQVTRCELYDLGLLTKSRFCHHEFKPLLRVNVPVHGGDSDFTFETSSQGLRGQEIVVPKPAGTYRIICLGDERTAATDLPEADTFCQQLQKFLQSRSKLRIEVINAGVPDYCPLLSSLQLQQKLSATQPDLVILNWDMSDVWDDYRYRRYTTMGAGGQPLGCSHPLLDPPRQREREQVMDLFLLPQFCVQNGCQLWAGRVLPAPPKDIDSPTGKYVWLQDQPPDWSVYIQQGLEAMLPARDLCEKLGGSFLVAVHAAPWQVATTASNGEGVREAVGVGQGVIYRSRAPFETITRFCEEQEVWCCDISPAVQADPLAVDAYQQDSSNYSPEGHLLAARVMATFLVKNLQGPWEKAVPATGSRSGLTAGRRGPDRY